MTLWNMENQKITSLVIMDLRAAFNTIEHQILLDVLLNQYGVECSAVAWFDTYLWPRRFQVNVNGARSTEKYLKYGVAQGSCSGPILYTAYASTLQYLTDPDAGLDPNGFADDHLVNKGFDANREEEEIPPSP